MLLAMPNFHYLWIRNLAGAVLWIAPLYHSYDLLVYKFDMRVSTCRYQGCSLPFRFAVRADVEFPLPIDVS
jgi:hypothetical protein